MDEPFKYYNLHFQEIICKIGILFFFFYSSIDICKQISFMFEEDEENAQRQTRMYALEAISAIIFHIWRFVYSPPLQRLRRDFET